MSAVLLDGTKIASDIRAELAGEVKSMTAAAMRMTPNPSPASSVRAFHTRL